jgi:hypothetical protein
MHDISKIANELLYLFQRTEGQLILADLLNLKAVHERLIEIK